MTFRNNLERGWARVVALAMAGGIGLRSLTKRRWLRWVAGIVCALVFAAAAPVVVTETACRAPARDVVDVYTPIITDAKWRRAEADSYLSYPEWYIVHAYEDFAGVLEHEDEHGFGYLRSIAGFWRSLCGVNRIVDREGDYTDTKIMLYTIGLSFTVELALKGAYEDTFGRLAAWIRGPQRTAEDRYALWMAKDYAAFLHQTPWYLYPFSARAGELWSVSSVPGDSAIRRTERRVALGLEWKAKAAYAHVIGYASAATLGPADLRIRSVVGNLDPALIENEPDVQIIDRLGRGRLLIETPRYQSFTFLIEKVAVANGNVVEIAGNDVVLVTALMPETTDDGVEGVRKIFSIDLQSRPGWRRVGLAVEVSRLAGLIRQIPATGGEFEHVYDY